MKICPVFTSLLKQSLVTVRRMIRYMLSVNLDCIGSVVWSDVQTLFSYIPVHLCALVLLSMHVYHRGRIGYSMKLIHLRSTEVRCMTLYYL